MKIGDFGSAAGSFWIWILLTVTTICHVPGVNGKLECDPDNNNGNCFCLSGGSEISVHCSDQPSPLNQAHINDFFSKLRIHNGLKDTATLELSSFNLKLSNLTNLDLTPLLRTKMNYFDMYSNKKLTGFSGSDTGTGTIDAYTIRFQYNAITSEGLDGVFKLFNGLGLNKIEMDHNELRGVPDLSTLQNLEHLDFSYNKISELKAESFRRLTNLQEIKLKNNPVEFVRDSAFLMDPPPASASNPSPYLTIDLGGTQLRSAGFSPKSGIDKIKKEVFLSIYEHFDSLPQDVFQPFLEANPNNVVNLQYNNKFQCDSRVKWLQDREKEFKNRVGGAKCSNDPGQTIWNSKKVSGDSNNSNWPTGPRILASLGFILFYNM